MMLFLIHPKDYERIKARADKDGVSMEEAFTREGVGVLRAMSDAGPYEAEKPAARDGETTLHVHDETCHIDWDELAERRLDGEA